MMQANQGFSLVEIVVVVGIVSLLSTVSVATYVEYRGQIAFDSAQAKLLEHIETGQQNARFGVENNHWSLALEVDRVTMFLGDDFTARDESFDQELVLPSDMFITGSDIITFTQVTGYPDAPALYQLQSSNDDSEIMINAYGTIEIQ